MFTALPSGLYAWNHCPWGLAEYVIIDRGQIAVLPDSISFLLMLRLYTMFSAFKKGDIESDSRVEILGCGGCRGHAGLQFGATLGYEIW